MKVKVKHVQSECTNSMKILTRLEDQICQLMNMIGDIKRKIGTSIPINTKDNLRRERNEHVKAIVLRLGKVLSSLETLTQE